MKITIYTISDCYFSKQEKDYLQSHSLAFEERNLEENRDYLTEMLTISNNFAGTPVTKIEKDDGQIVILKGFTKEEFDKTFNFTDDTPTVTPEPPAVVSAPSPTMPDAVMSQTAPVEPVVQPTPVVKDVSTPDMDSIQEQIAKLKALQESLAAQTVARTQTPPAPATTAPVAPAYVPPPAPPVVTQAPAPQPVAPPQTAPATAPTPAVDDSLAAILAELQAKISTSQPGSGSGTPPTTN